MAIRDAFDAGREVESPRAENASLTSEIAANKLNLANIMETLARATYFRGVDRNQVVRIAFDAPTDFPLMAKIRVTGPYGLSNLVESALGAFVPRGEAEAAPAKKIIGN